MKYHLWTSSAIKEKKVSKNCPNQKNFTKESEITTSSSKTGFIFPIATTCHFPTLNRASIKVKSILYGTNKCCLHWTSIKSGSIGKRSSFKGLPVVLISFIRELKLSTCYWRDDPIKREEPGILIEESMMKDLLPIFAKPNKSSK